MRKIIYEGGSSAITDILCIIDGNKIMVDLNDELTEVLIWKDNKLYETESTLYPQGTVIFSVLDEKVYSGENLSEPVFIISEGKVHSCSSSRVIATIVQKKEKGYIYYDESTNSSDIALSIEIDPITNLLIHDIDIKDSTGIETSPLEFIALWHFLNNRFDYGDIDDWVL